jgi:NADPH:quinone reductase-like Zn-dependent oxidoreductase
MLAARNHRFGAPDVVRIERIPLPDLGDDQLLVRVGASTVSAADWRLRTRNVPRGFGILMGLVFGFRRPRYFALGTEAAGEVVAVGQRVETFFVHDRVVANLGMKLGGHAQYVAISASAAVAKIPDAVSFESAAALVFGGTTALVFLRDKLALRHGETLLVVGAGGAVGSAAVQLGREMGAVVTGVCSQKKASRVAGLGATRVIAYESTDWRKETERYDVILDTVGGTTFENSRHKLSEKGRIGLVVADLPLMLRSAWLSLFHRQKVRAGSVSESAADLDYLLSLCERGRFQPLIGGVFPLDQVARAHEVVESGHKTGSIVLSLP